MKSYVLIFLMASSLLAYGQPLTKTDSLNIGFKAKLMTLTDYGTTNQKQLLDDLTNQKLEFLNTIYKNFVFMKIKLSQPYGKLNDGSFVVSKDCYYYVGFNLKTFQYYKIGGFNYNNIDTLIKDIDNFEINVFSFDNITEIEDIDVYCLYNYYKTKPRRRLKQNKSCFTSCNSKKMYVFKIED